MGGVSSALLLEIGADGYEDEELARITGRLRAELLELDVRAVELAGPGAAPSGAKGLPNVAAAGELVVRFAGREVLQAVVSGIVSWLSRQRCHSIKLTVDGDTLEVTGISTAQQDKLVSLWISRHGG